MDDKFFFILSKTNNSIADQTSVFSMSTDFLLQCTNTDFHEQKFKQ